MYLLSPGFKHMPSCQCSLSTPQARQQQIPLAKWTWWLPWKKDNMNVVLKRQIRQDGHAELGGYARDPRVHMRCPFRGRVFTFFSSVPVTGTQFPVPSGAVWHEPGLKCNLGSSQEYYRNLGLWFSNLLFSYHTLPFLPEKNDQLRICCLTPMVHHASTD